MSTSVEIRVLRSTPRTRPLVAFAAVVMASSALPWLFGRAVGYFARSAASDAGTAAMFALTYAMPALLLAPLAAFALLFRSMRRVDRLGMGTLVGAYAVWIIPAMVDARTFAAETRLSVARFEAIAGPPRRAVRADPVLAARAAAAAGETSFLTVSDFDALSAIPNACLWQRFGLRKISATADVALPGQARFRRRARAFAVRYNATMAAALGLSRAEMERTGGCVPRYLGEWPAEAGGVRR
ncbi:MAG TPA: hypothetical protein VEX86_27130 [Longimicrobium sp.]|nr:hypothetical protein [Longimicrobium sp.]